MNSGGALMGAGLPASAGGPGPAPCPGRAAGHGKALPIVPAGQKSPKRSQNTSERRHRWAVIGQGRPQALGLDSTTLSGGFPPKKNKILSPHFSCPAPPHGPFRQPARIRAFVLPGAGSFAARRWKRASASRWAPYELAWSPISRQPGLGAARRGASKRQNPPPKKKERSPRREAGWSRWAP